MENKFYWVYSLRCSLISAFMLTLNLGPAYSQSQATQEQVQKKVEVKEVKEVKKLVLAKETPIKVFFSEENARIEKRKAEENEKKSAGVNSIDKLKIEDLNKEIQISAQSTSRARIFNGNTIFDKHLLNYYAQNARKKV